jgi:hypothetical protein
MSANPLAKHFRQPSIYMKLPSAGRFWPSDALSLTVTGDIPVYPMTAKDEIVLRTPDALMNGQGIIDVIQSCCPNITDAWKMPSIDVDAVLIAIRIASYGNQMDVDVICPKCKHEHTIGVDLSYLLDNVIVPDYTTKINFTKINIKLHPQQYFSVNAANQIRYEEQRILNTLTAENIPEDVRLAEYTEHIKKIVDLNINILVNSTEYIETDDGTIVNDPTFINEFYLNCDTEIVHGLQSKLSDIAKEAGIPDIKNTCPACEKEYSLPMEFDYSNFFARKSLA